MESVTRCMTRWHASELPGDSILAKRGDLERSLVSAEWRRKQEQAGKTGASAGASTGTLVEQRC